MTYKIKKMINNGTEYKLGSIDSSNDTYENIIHLTQEEYDALETKDPDTLYSTPDSESPGVFNPENEGATGQVLTKTETGYAWKGDNSIYADLFLVGGGGGGGSFTSGGRGVNGGGGGGAGQVIEQNKFLIKKGCNYCVSIGLGGAQNSNGGTTSFGDIYAIGGGRGGEYGYDTISTSCGGDGGNGGGGGGWYNCCQYGCVWYSCGGASVNLGHQGGAGGFGLGGGGGGAGGDGSIGGDNCGMRNGRGGNGIYRESFDGLNYFAAGGGGGGRLRTSYAACVGGIDYCVNGGKGGGGSGGIYDLGYNQPSKISGGNGTTYGSGGGGSGYCCNTSCCTGCYVGGCGAQGVAYICIPIGEESLNITTTGDGVTCGEYCGYCIYKFTCDGTFTIN